MISVLGAGVVGLCVATTLVEAGFAVEVIVPEGAAAAVSAMAGGMLAPFCEGESAPRVIETRGQGAAEWWRARVPNVTTGGTLVVSPPRDASELDRFARATRGHVWADPGALEPDLSGRFSRGLFFAEEAHLDPSEALEALRVRLVARDVRFHSGAPNGRIVDCTGIDARERLTGLRAVRGEVMELRAPDVSLTRTLRLLHPRFPVYIVPRGAGRYVIGASMVESEDARAVTVRGAMELLSAAFTLHPGFGEAEILSQQAGLRPAFADNLPRVTRQGGTIFVNGMYRHGFLMAPALAADVAAILQEEQVSCASF